MKGVILDAIHKKYSWSIESILIYLKNKFIRSPVVRIIAIIVLTASILSLTLTPIASIIVEGWFRQDIEIRSRLILRSIKEHLLAALDDARLDITPYLEKITEDERLLALGYCSEAGELLYATDKMPEDINCRQLHYVKPDGFDIEIDGQGHVHVSFFAFGSGTKSGHILVVHDLSFIDQRLYQAKLYTIIALMGTIVGMGILSIGVIATIMRAWMFSRHVTIKDMNDSKGQKDNNSNDFLNRDLKKILKSLQDDRDITNSFKVSWSPETLELLIQKDLPNSEILIVSNREPYIHNFVEDKIQLQIPASGLVSALEPIMRACHGIWIAHGSGSADKDTVDCNDIIKVPPKNPAYKLRRVWLSEGEQEGYYYGASNEGIWPLCHIAFVKPQFRDEDWDQYIAVNKKFAEVVFSEITCDDPIILVQDYHFSLLPRIIRQRLPNAIIISFWHIPWPNSETFSICPWRNEILDGLLGSSIIGFQTQFHCNNFMESVDRFIESRLDRDNNSVTLGGHETLIRPYPISIEWPPSVMSVVPQVQTCRKNICREFDLPENIRIIIGIERFDYTKGILDRINAVDKLLTAYPEWNQRFVLIQAVAPTRSALGSYRDLQADAIKIVNDINLKYGKNEWKPIHLCIRHHEQSEVYELFRAADACLVSSLHDGMNLVAKEFVAARDDELGVLILSTFAGASNELLEAIIVNPYDSQSMAAAIVKALRMDNNEQRERMRLMRDSIRQNNVYGWAAHMLLQASRLRKQRRVKMYDLMNE